MASSAINSCKLPVLNNLVQTKAHNEAQQVATFCRRSSRHLKHLEARSLPLQQVDVQDEQNHNHAVTMTGCSKSDRMVSATSCCLRTRHQPTDMNHDRCLRRLNGLQPPTNHSKRLTARAIDANDGGRSFSVCQRLVLQQVVNMKSSQRCRMNSVQERQQTLQDSSMNGGIDLLRTRNSPSTIKLTLVDDQIGTNSTRLQPQACDSEKNYSMTLSPAKTNHLEWFKTSVWPKVMTTNNSNYGNNGKVPTAQKPKHDDATSGEESSPLRSSIQPLLTNSNRLNERNVTSSDDSLHADKNTRTKSASWQRRRWPPIVFATKTLVATVAILLALAQPSCRLIATQTLQTDPRPTIYSGQISFGLLLSAHSSPGAELSTAASSLGFRRLSRAGGASIFKTIDEPPPSELSSGSSGSGSSPAPPYTTTPQLLAPDRQIVIETQHRQEPTLIVNNNLNQTLGNGLLSVEPISDLIAEASATNGKQSYRSDEDDDDDDEDGEGGVEQDGPHKRRRQPRARSHLERRQIFERPSLKQVRHQQQALELQKQQALAAAKQQQAAVLDSACSQVNPSALYAGMGAIWASHQANLVGDSQLAIGTYVYDSCNDLEIGQRQSVRIVSNLNAFQQTTCESPRGSPISLTIAHGENQLRAIQLLTSFRVPVITTKEPFALEDYHLLTKDQRRFLFSTAPSSRHLAAGAIRFTKRVVSRVAASPKLPNQFYKMSSKNGLVVISRNLPAKFIAHLTDTIPREVNYEILESNQPIDQVRSVEMLESILKSKSDGQYSSSSSSSSGNSNQESRVSLVRTAPNPVVNSRIKRNDDQESGGSGGSSDQDSDEPSQQQQHRMLSPTILMFITPSEAIDLVTRLRNDLAEVSRYYSLVVTTREDISPALRTIFHRGGSRLCSGKAFYTISPKPDEVHEFSRYFRDTVQMEGEVSEHPLICEFAKHQQGSRSNSDLDDIGTEAVIKAVWSAAAAFKLVHKRECSAAMGSTSGVNGASGGLAGNLYNSNTANEGGAELTSRSLKQGRRQSQTMAGTSTGSGSGGNASAKTLTPYAECLIKMNKNMASLVQRTLRKLDVHINSTGLHSLDGFRIRFDESNELLTNKFSIKYINKECEITEIGEYSGTNESDPVFDDNELVKALESTVPDSWPVAVVTPPPPPAASSSAASNSKASTTPSSSNSASDSPSSSTSGSNQDDSAGASDSTGSSQPDSSSSSGSSSEDASPSPSKNSNDDEQDSTSGADNDKQLSVVIEKEAPKRRRSNGKAPKRKGAMEVTAGSKQQPVSMLSGRASEGNTPGLTDFATETSGRTTLAPTTHAKGFKKLTTNGPSFPPTTTSHQSKYSSQRNSSSSSSGEQSKPMRELKPFPAGKSVALKEWLPKQQPRDESDWRLTATATTQVPHRSGSITTSSETEMASEEPAVDGEVVTSLTPTTSTTQATSNTLPESDGNTDLDMPAFKTSATTTRTSTTRAPPSTRAIGSKTARSSADMTAAGTTTTELTTGSDYVTLPSIVRTTSTTHQYDQSGGGGSPQPVESLANDEQRPNVGHRSFAVSGDLTLEQHEPRLGYIRDLNSSPVPLSAPTTSRSASASASASHGSSSENDTKTATTSRNEQRTTSRTKLRSHLKWIYSSWFTLAILGANICGALITLYVLTFLLIKNCDGSLDRENQGIRSMHLLSVIVVLFGSTLFIVYPTPSLCLLRSSWHNFALVLMFGSLLLQTMQTRSVSSIGLGGRPNRLNQFLTLIFMVGVQVSFELQRWKYESANYVNFVNQYFSSQENGDKKLLIFSNSIAGQFNPLNSFDDQVTPVSIQVSEKYQNLLHDYCSQPVEDFLQGQFYLWIIMGLLIVFSITNRRLNVVGATRNGANQIKGGLLAQARGKRKKTKFQTNQDQSATAYTLTSGKLLASQHETNELMTSAPHLSPAAQTFGGSAPFSVGSKVTGRHSDAGDVFLVTLISVPIYFISIVLHVHGQNFLMASHHDLVASVTMVLIAFTVLIGIFLPVLSNYHRFGELVSSSPMSPSSSSALSSNDQTHLGSGGGSASLAHPILGAATLAAARKKHMPYQPGANQQHSPASGAFAMFPEFASTGLRRPSSIGGDSIGRRPFAETKESRRNMGLSLANLPPEPDSLRSLCVHNHRSSSSQQAHHQHNNHSHHHHNHRKSTSNCNEHQTAVNTSANVAAMPNLRLNLAGVDEESPTSDHNHNNHHHHHHHHHDSSESFAHKNQPGSQKHNHHSNYQQAHHNHHQHHHRKSQPNASSRRSSIASSTGEKRLIMLDVDPCCPRHGVTPGSLDDRDDRR